MNQQKIYFLGIDGSGKTTLAKNIVARFKSENKPVKYLYARYRPFLSQPFKLISKLLIYKKDTEFRNFEKYSQKKSSFSKRHPLLAKTYLAVCLLDYMLVCLPLVYYKLFRSPVVIIDRYIADFAITLTVAVGLDKNEMIRLIRFLNYFFPKADKVFFVNVDVNTAFKRKNDIPSELYLIERKELYLALSDVLNFIILDGNVTPEELVNNVLLKLNGKEEK